MFLMTPILKLTDRFQKQNQMEALESFKLKMDADTFAWALRDIKSTFLWPNIVEVFHELFWIKKTLPARIGAWLRKAWHSA